MFDVDKIPANEWLPGEVHSLADEFRANEERLAAFSAKRAELSHAIHTAKLEDAGALKAAVLAGKDTPPETNRQKAEAALAEHMRREPVLRGERARLVAALTQALRGDNRDKVAEIIQAKAAPAVTEYVAAVREATAKIAEAYQAVGKCQPALDLIRVLDAGETQLRVPAPAALSAGPVETFAARVADLHTRPDFDPTQQRVVVDAETGETYTAAADLIAVWLAEGKTLRIVDGWPVPGIQPNRITLSARGSDAVPGRLLGPTTNSPRGQTGPWIARGPCLPPPVTPSAPAVPLPLVLPVTARLVVAHSKPRPPRPGAGRADSKREQEIYWRSQQLATHASDHHAG